MKAFAEEMVLIKAAEAQAQEEPWQFPNKEQWKQLGKDTIYAAIGSGLGAGAAHAFNEKVLPKIMENTPPKAVPAIAYGLGTIGGLLSAVRMKKRLERWDRAKAQRNG